MGILAVAHLGVPRRFGCVEQLRQVGNASGGAGPARAPGPDRGRSGTRGNFRNGRTDHGDRPAHAAIEERISGTAGWARRGPRRLGTAQAVRQGTSARLGSGHGEVPATHATLNSRSLDLHHRHDADQPLVTVLRPTPGAASRRRLTGRGLLDRDFGGVRVRPSPDRHPADARRSRHRRVALTPDLAGARRRPEVAAAVLVYRAPPRPSYRSDWRTTCSGSETIGAGPGAARTSYWSRHDDCRANPTMDRPTPRHHQSHRRRVALLSALPVHEHSVSEPKAPSCDQQVYVAATSAWCGRSAWATSSPFDAAAVPPLADGGWPSNTRSGVATCVLAKW
jgi:hypothetical protein